MGLIKIVILGLLIWIGFRLYKTFQQRQNTLRAKPKQLSGDLVMCHACGVHLPKETAILENGHFYCSSENPECTR